MTPAFPIILTVLIALLLFFGVWKESKGQSDSEWWKKVPKDKWRWYGYYNKDDKRLFIWGRKFGLGWTINNANPYAILAYAGILLFMLMIIIFTSN